MEPRLSAPHDACRTGVYKTRNATLASKATDAALAKTDVAGKVGSALAPLANAAIAQPNSLPRRVMQRLTGISAERILPPYQRTRFSTWFKKRSPRDATASQRRDITALVFPTCLVEYQDTQVGQDLVHVYERNGIECQLPPGQVCCGAPLLHQGNVEGFVANATTNIKVLADALRVAQSHGQPASVVVPQPTCGYVLKFDYPDYVPGPDAQLVAEATKDACEFLVDVHKADRASGGEGLDTDFVGEVPATTTYHAPCHLRAQNVGLRSRDLLKLTGTNVTVVAECSGIDGTWGLRAENVEISRKVARKMASDIERAGSDAIAGDCSLANGGITLETGTSPQHPLSLIARAYGIDPER